MKLWCLQVKWDIQYIKAAFLRKEHLLIIKPLMYRWGVPLTSFDLIAKLILRSCFQCLSWVMLVSVLQNWGQKLFFQPCGLWGLRLLKEAFCLHRSLGADADYLSIPCASEEAINNILLCETRHSLCIGLFYILSYSLSNVRKKSV